jgi:DNA-binding NtrC family response regulator
MMNTAFDQKKALLQNAMEEFEKRFIAEVFERSHGNRADTAEILGIDRKTLYILMQLKICSMIRKMFKKMIAG